MAMPVAGDQVPRLGNVVTRALGRALLALLRAGALRGSCPNTSKFVAIGSHKSYCNVVIGLSVVVSLGLRVNWMAKHTAFKPPFGAIIKRLGGVPINRTATANVVDQMTQKVKNATRIILVVMPEGSAQTGRCPGQ